MKVVFAGPTLHGVATAAFPSIVFRPPARCGDVVRAVREGAAMIGLVDGVFERVPAVWHKEILYALSRGITVLGAASMGALRAAECDAFGMIGVGAIYEAYARGLIEDDEDVTQLHGPAELGYAPLSEPLVNIRATLERLRACGVLDEPECEALTASARAIFFKERTYRKIVEQAGISPPRQAEIAVLLKSMAVNPKQRDAEQLLSMMENDEIPVTVDNRQVEWRLAHTRSLAELLRNGCGD